MREIHIAHMKQRNASAGLITVTCRFESEIIVMVDGRKLNGKSIMNTSIIEKAEKLDFIINGTDEKDAENAICTYFGIIPIQSTGN